MQAGLERARFLRAVGIAVAATALFAVWLAAELGGELVVRWVDDVATLLAAAGAALLCVQAGSRHSGRQRVSWWLFAAACGAWALGELIWALYDLVLRGEVPVPSWADAAYLTAMPLAAAALLSHPAAATTRKRTARSVLDALVIAMALLFLGWTAVLGPLWHSTDLSTAAGLVSLAYPFGDVLVVFFVVLVIRGMRGGSRLDLWCLLAGLLALTLSDATYAYLTQVEGYATGNLIDTGWLVGYLCIALGAYCARAEVAKPVPASPWPSPAAVLIPFLPMLAALTVAAVRMQLGHRLDRAAWSMALVLVLLVLARQALLVWDILSRAPERDGDGLIRVLESAIGDRAELETAGDGARR